MIIFPKLQTMLAATGLLLLTLSSAQAGDGNEIRILQDSPAGGPGNTLTVDQSRANNSMVTGFDSGQTNLEQMLQTLPPDGPFDLTNLVTLEGPAIQTGGNNSAILTISEDAGAEGTSADPSTLDRRGVIALYQENDGTGPNSATVDITNNAFGAVFQNGGSNIADLAVNGGPFDQAQTQGAIVQNGIGNDTSLTVTGIGTRSSLTLNGDDNDVALDTNGPANINYTLNASGVSNVNLQQFESAVPGISVFSNSQTVTITQTQQ